MGGSECLRGQLLCWHFAKGEGGSLRCCSNYIKETSRQDNFFSLFLLHVSDSVYVCMCVWGHSSLNSKWNEEAYGRQNHPQIGNWCPD